MQAKTLAELADYVSGRVCGDKTIKIHSASTLGRATEGQISFLANNRYEKQMHTTKASAVIVGREIAGAAVPLLIAEDPYYAFMQIMVLLHGHRKHVKTGISQHAYIADTAKIGADCDIHPFATVDNDAVIGNNCILYPGVYIGQGVQVGNDVIIYPNVTIYDGCKIGNRVIINANSTLGEDGFGYASHNGAHHKIPQIGSVIIEDDVEIQSLSAVDRATVGESRVQRGAKIDNLVQVGHSSVVGEDNIICAQAGLAGSSILEKDVLLAGQVGISGHLRLGEGVIVTAQSGVPRNVKKGTMISGSPAVESRIWRRAVAVFPRLPDILKRMRQLERRLEDLAANVNKATKTDE